MPEKKINKTILIILLGLLAAMGPLAIAMYIPGFAAIAKEFKVANNQVAFTMTSYFIGITIGQLAYGPIIDKYGRKKPLMYSLLLFVITSIGCAISLSLDMMVVLRFLQALGGSAAMVSSMAIISDVYEPDARAKAFSLIMLILGVAPIISPSLGSFFVKYFHWGAIFYFLAGFGTFVAIAFYIFIPETGKYMYPERLKVKKAFNDYLSVLKTKTFLFYALGGSISNSVIFAFVASSPFVFMGYYKIEPTTFALLYGISASGVMLGNYINGLLVKKIHYLKLLKISSVILVVTALLFATIVFMAPAISFEWVVAGLFLVLFCMGVVYPNAVTASLAPFTKLSGSASALMGSLMMGLSALVTAVIGVLAADSSFTMFAVMAVLSILSVVCLQLADRFTLKKESAKISVKISS